MIQTFASWNRIARLRQVRCHADSRQGGDEGTKQVLKARLQRVERHVMTIQGGLLFPTRDLSQFATAVGCNPELQPEQDAESLAYVGEGFGGRLRFKNDSASLPVEVLDVIGKDNAGDLVARRQRNLEWIPFHVTPDGAGNCQPRLRVIDARRENNRGTPTSLLVAGLRIKS